VNIITNPDNKLSLKLMLLFIPVAYASYLFHEFGHWVIGEVLGNNMAYTLNNVWPKNGHYLDPGHDVLVSIGGPACTILLSLFLLLVIEKYKTMVAYPIVLFQLVFRLLALMVGGFELQDEAIISKILALGKYTIAIIVLLLLFLIVCRASYLLRINLKKNSYLFTMSTLCDLLVIGSSKIMS
jgi:hypothetical protein